MPNPTVEEMVEHLGLEPEYAKYIYRQNELATEAYDADPSLGITAHIIGGDRASAERAWAEAEAGRWDERAKEAGERPFEYAATFVGSYARLDFIVRAYEAGHISREWLFRKLPGEWRGSDPVDTDPRFLALWREAYAANGNQMITDAAIIEPGEPHYGETLPPGDPVRIYRGQDRGTKPGIAWSTDLAIAEKFARGAALRQGKRNGNVLVATVPRDKVIGFLVGRGESELICDPADVTYVSYPIDGGLQPVIVQVPKDRVREVNRLLGRDR